MNSNLIKTIKLTLILGITSVLTVGCGLDLGANDPSTPGAPSASAPTPTSLGLTELPPEAQAQLTAQYNVLRQQMNSRDGGAQQYQRKAIQSTSALTIYEALGVVFEFIYAERGFYVPPKVTEINMGSIVLGDSLLSDEVSYIRNAVTDPFAIASITNNFAYPAQPGPHRLGGVVWQGHDDIELVSDGLLAGYASLDSDNNVEVLFGGAIVRKLDGQQASGANICGVLYQASNQSAVGGCF